MSSISVFAPAFKSRQGSTHFQQQSLRKQKRERSRVSGKPHSASNGSDTEVRASTPFSDIHSGLDGLPSGKDIAEPSSSKDSVWGVSVDTSSSDEDWSDDEGPMLQHPSSQRHRTRRIVRKELSDHTGVRQQHLAVIMAILHRCLLARDYVRAGRAWGMLLRAESQGHPMDVRKNGQWGIGAEILLFRETQLTQARIETDERDEGKIGHPMIRDRQQQRQQPPLLFSREGFEKARDYYERLILQYPYRKTMPNAISALQFYPAMFGLWIYAVQEKHKSILNNSRQGYCGSAENELFDATNVRAMTAQSASEIAARLDELLVSPPYSDQAELWRVRGMVALWTADLLRKDQDREAMSEREGAISESSSVVDQAELERAEAEQRNYRKRQSDAKSEARGAFNKTSEFLD